MSQLLYLAQQHLLNLQQIFNYDTRSSIDKIFRLCDANQKWYREKGTISARSLLTINGLSFNGT